MVLRRVGRNKAVKCLSKKRKEILGKAQEILVEEAPYTYAWQPPLIFAARKNVEFTPSSGIINVYEIKIK